MDTSTAVRQRILDLCRQRGITVNRLATISGVTQSTVNNIVSGRNHSATVATIKKLCDGLDITLRDFFDAAVFEELWNRRQMRRLSPESLLFHCSYAPA